MAQNQSPDEKLPKIAYSIAEATRAVSIGRTQIFADIAAGRLPVKKHGRRTLILDSDLRAYVENLPGKAA